MVDKKKNMICLNIRGYIKYKEWIMC